MAHEIFISYSHKDVETADRICSEIENKQITCWMAPRDIEEGEEWAKAITNALADAKIFLLIFSSNSNLSDQVMREVNIAISNKLVIVPVKVEDFEPTGSMLYYLSTLHWIELSDKNFDDQIIRLKGRLSRILDSGSDDPKEDSQKGPGYNRKKKKLYKLIIPIAASILILLSFVIFGDKIFNKSALDSDLNKNSTNEQTVDLYGTTTEQPATSTEALETAQPTSTVSAEPQPEDVSIAYIYNEEDNTIKFQVFTLYSKGTIYVNGVAIETDLAQRIDNILQFVFNADQINLYDTLTLAIKLEDDDKDDLITTWSNYFFCCGDYDISNLENYPNLEYLYLTGEGITGDISSLKNMKILKRMDINNCPNLEGDIQVLESFPELTGLGILNSDNISGDIGIIGELINLEYIDMLSDSFFGELKTFAEIDGLEQLYVGYCSNVTGNIADLNSMQKMNMLYLDHCSGIYGDISGLNDLSSITRIFILDTDRLEGDIASFSALNTIERIYLSDCEGLYGDIGDLSTLENMNSFAVVNCANIKGTLTLPTGATVIANE